MTMVAFDANRNDRIDENEFISAIQKARENAPPAQETAQLQASHRRELSPGNMGEMTLSTIGGPKRDEDVDTNTIVLRQIFAEVMIKSRMKLDALEQDGLLILPNYWSKEPAEFDEDKFVMKFCEES